jgi:NADH dehydrogenase [ubiquinone] 1 alpha subcomplex assembly factor 7
MDGDAPLAERIADRIRREGPISFDAFMEAALYDPIEGFYTSPPVGEGGDFVTSPHVSPAFGVLLARLIEDLWGRLGRPRRFRIIEAGAGDGTLAERIMASLPDSIASAGPYLAVERSAGARARLSKLATRLAPSRNLRVLERLTDERSAGNPPDGAATGDPPDSAATGDPPDGAATDEPAAGVVIANELLDNLPFRRFRGTAAGPVELCVGLDGDRFALVETPPEPADAATMSHLAPAEEGIASRAALDVVERAASAISRGYVLMIDYAAPSTGDAAVHGYRRHRVEPDVLDAPGTRDITAGVDFPAVVEHARRLGLRVWGPVRQREALLNLGFRRWEWAIRQQQSAASKEGDGRAAVRAFSARTRAGLLIAREGLGGFFVLCLGVGDPPPPRPDLLLDGEREPTADDTIELDLRDGRVR